MQVGGEGLQHFMFSSSPPPLIGLIWSIWRCRLLKLSYEGKAQKDNPSPAHPLSGSSYRQKKARNLVVDDDDSDGDGCPFLILPYHTYPAAVGATRLT